MIDIDRRAVRGLALWKQGLHERPSRVDKALLLRVVRRIGMLQLDSVNVVERSHYLVMLSRVGLYRKSELDELVYPDKALLEQWVHCASLIPMADFRYFMPVVRKRRAAPLSPWRKAALGSRSVLDKVYGAVVAHGPRTARDFADRRKTKRQWWSRKPERVALDHLALTGKLVVEKRVGFQCSYDLLERVVPKEFRSDSVDLPEFYRWTIQRSLDGMGVATAQHIADYYRQPMAPVRAELRKLEAEGLIVAVRVEGWRHDAYVLASDLSALRTFERTGEASSVTTLLSPFDNLIWHRARTKDLFDFTFKNEMYTAVKDRERVHGYYLMPILHRGRLVGRVDPKADRAGRRLLLKNVAMEQGADLGPDFVSAFADAISEFMAFHDCESVIVERSNAERLRRDIMKMCNAPTAADAHPRKRPG